MSPDDLLTIAKSLASGRIAAHRGRPRQAELRRAISAAYYALFHTLANSCANLLVGSRSSTRTRQAWRQAYRSLDHGQVKKQCTERRPRRVLQRFPQAVQDFAEHFVNVQRLRHLADYDPLERFVRSEVSQVVEQSESIILEFNQVSREDRRAFAIFVLFNLRID